MLKLRDLLVDSISWSARDESQHAHLSWIAPWNMEYYKDSGYGDTSYAFNMNVDWYEPKYKKDAHYGPGHFNEL